MTRHSFFTDQQQSIKLRLDLALKLTRLSIDDFCQRQDISRSTLFSWKNGRKPLTLKGMEKLAQALENEGVFCSADWLLEGKGLSPRTLQEKKEGLRSMIEHSHFEQLDEMLDQEVKILKEIEAFRQINTQADVLFVTDDAVAPFIRSGDYVGGIRVDSKDVHKALNRVCLVRLNNNQLLLRHVSQGLQENHYTLSCPNPLALIEEPILYNTTVMSLAPLVWIRYTQE